MGFHGSMVIRFPQGFRQQRPTRQLHIRCHRRNCAARPRHLRPRMRVEIETSESRVYGFMRACSRATRDSNQIPPQQPETAVTSSAPLSIPSSNPPRRQKPHGAARGARREERIIHHPRKPSSNLPAHAQCNPIAGRTLPREGSAHSSSEGSAHASSGSSIAFSSRDCR